MKDHKSKFFNFQPCDYKAVEQWLCEMAQGGWELSELVLAGNFSRAHFSPLARDGLRYCVDLAPFSRRGAREREEAAPLYADAGWELVGTINHMDIYKSAPGRVPLPLQTDPELEQRRFGRAWLSRTLLSTLAFLAVVALLTAVILRFTPGMLYFYLLSNAALFVLSAFLFVLIYVPVDGLLDVFYWWKSRAAVASGKPMPSSGVLRARLRGRAALLVTLLLMCVQFSNLFFNTYGTYPQNGDRQAAEERMVLRAGDLGLTGADLFYVRTWDSAALSRLAASQAPEDHSGNWTLREDQFRLRWSWVAGPVLLGLRLEHGVLTPTELGFDESYTGLGKNGATLLLLRQGHTVLLLESTQDLTDPEVLAVLRVRLAEEATV